MNKKEKEKVLIKVMEKAIKNGFKIRDNDGVLRTLSGWRVSANCDRPVITINFANNGTVISRFLERILYGSHDFARAFWGREFEDKLNRYGGWCKDCHEFSGKRCYKESDIRGFCVSCGERLSSRPIYNEYLWTERLREMVLEEEPIKYLKKFA